MKKHNYNIIFILFIIIIIILGIILFVRSKHGEKYNSRNNFVKFCSTIDPILSNRNGALNAVSTKNYLWTGKNARNTNNNPLTIAFINKPPRGFKRTCTVKTPPKNNERDGNGNLIKWDPLEKALLKTDIIDAIKKIVMERYSPIVNVKFKFLPYKGSNTKADIRINFNNEDINESAIGTLALKIKNDPTMYLGWFDVANVLHQFGHVLGLFHEHQSPLSTIDWNIDMIKKYTGADESTIFRDLIKKESKSEVNYTNYDPNSIMLYFYPGIFTWNKKHDGPGKGTPLNTRLSLTDMNTLAKLYPTNPAKSVKDFWNKIYK
jgi:hypothetical protein